MRIICRAFGTDDSSNPIRVRKCFWGMNEIPEEPILEQLLLVEISKRVHVKDMLAAYMEAIQKRELKSGQDKKEIFD